MSDKKEKFEVGYRYLANIKSSSYEGVQEVEVLEMTDDAAFMKVHRFNGNIFWEKIKETTFVYKLGPSPVDKRIDRVTIGLKNELQLLESKAKHFRDALKEEMDASSNANARANKYLDKLFFRNFLICTLSFILVFVSTMWYFYE